MKKLVLLALALAPLFTSTASIATPTVAAQDACPCADYRFVPKNEKAKAVAAFWNARREYKIASGIGTVAVLFTAMSRRPSAELNDAQREMGDAESVLMRTRARAVELHGLTVQGDGPQASVVITLEKGADYDFKDPH